MAGRAAHQSPSEPPASPARARCARRAGAGGARGAWLPPTTTRIPRRARGARVQALTAPLHAPHGKVSRAQPQTTTGTYGTSARRGPGGCGRAVWPMAITHAHEDPALSPARPCAAPHRVPCGAPGRGESRPNHPGTYGTGPTCTPREGGSTVRSLAPTLSHRSQGASTSKKLPCCWLINNPPHQNLRHLRAAPRGGLERAAAGPPGSRTASATVAVRALGPCMAPERKPEASTTRASPLTAWHPAPHEWAKVCVTGAQHGCGWPSRCRPEPGVHPPVL